jgi:ribosome-binding ATPase YchF (GTP1/OBG family)
VRGAHTGEGLGNKFLANIRETDAILHVVRAHDDASVVHPEGRVDPMADLETIETELLYADLEQAERRLERVARQAKSGDAALRAEERWLVELVAALGAGRPARSVPPAPDAPDALTNLQPLTAKPVLYVVNVGEAEGSPEPSTPIAERAASAGAEAVAVSARLEAELAELDPDEAEAMREDLGAPESGLARVVRAAFELLELISFFTAGVRRRPAPTPSRRARPRTGRRARSTPTSSAASSGPRSCPGTRSSTRAATPGPGPGGAPA